MKKIITGFIFAFAVLPSIAFALCPNFVPGQLSASALNNAIASPCITSGTIANVAITNATISSSTVSGLAGSFTTLSASSNVTVGGTLASSGVISAPSLTLTSQASAPSQAVRLDQLPYPYRNRLINGDMQVSQLNAASSVTPTTTDTYPIDQWKVDATQASKLTFQQVVDAPAGFKYSEKVTVAAQFSPGATDRFAIYQPIEGQNLIDFGLGTAAPSTIAASMWLKCSTAGTYALGINNAGTRSYVGTVSCTTSWAKQTVVLVGDNTGTWATDNTIGAQFYIDLGSGSNFNTTAGAWQAGDFTRTTGTATFVNLAAGQTFQITGAQFEQVPTGATQGTGFEFLAYESQLRKSQRYLPCWNSTSTGHFLANAFSVSATALNINLTFLVPTRVAVTGIVSTTSSGFTFTQGAANFVLSTGPGFVLGGTTGAFLSGSSSGMSATVGVAGMLYANSATAQICMTGAQL